MAENKPKTGAEALLTGLAANGIDYVFANAGTDFPPIIEAFVARGADGVLPEPVTVPHETAALAMAHGYYLVTGKPQAIMVHVNVGLANAVMGAINAAGDNIPVVIMSGRTPITEHGRPGARMTPIQYGQEVYDQSGLMRDVCKFDYEMRYPEQGGQLANRAVTLALSEPRGPVYLSLPREPLTEVVPDEAPWEPRRQVPATPARPDPDAIEAAADLLAAADAPLVICQRSDTQGRAAAALSRLANEFALPVVEPFSIRSVLASSEPMLAGYGVNGPLAEADVVLVVDSQTPWIERQQQPKPDARVIHLGPDPLFRRLPMRSFRTDLAIACDPAEGLAALAAAMAGKAASRQDAVADRRDALTARSAKRRAAAATAAEAGCAAPMSAEWLSKCLSDILDEDGVVFSELGTVLGPMDLKGPNRVFTTPHSGGLGWGMAAALGAQLAAKRAGSDRLNVACVGDGSYMFANPVVCHQIAEALELPILTIVKNNGIWNAVRRSVVQGFPQGAAVKANAMPLVSLEPAPDYCRIAEASRAHAERVEHGADLPGALQRALKVIREERRQALLDVRVAVSDSH